MPQTRRTFLAASFAAMTHMSWRAAWAGEVSWLADVQKAPALPDAAKTILVPLLVDRDGQPIGTLDAWKVERAHLRRKWLGFLGPMPTERPAIKLEVLEEDRPLGCLRQRVRFDSEPGVPIDGYLLRPTADRPGRDAAGRRPALVALHPTTNDTIDEIAGRRGPAIRQLGLNLARRGFVVFCPKNFLWQDAPDYAQAVANFKTRHPQTRGMHKMLWDAMRSVDLLETLADDVDPKRIGAVGHSLGAKEALYVAAFDERVAAAVASEGGIGFPFTNWDAPWYLGPEIKPENKPAEFAFEHHQLLALIAPRAFLILGGESGPGAADGDRTWPYVEAALGVYRFYGSPARLGLYNHRQGHTISETTYEKLAEWLEAYLKDEG